MEITAGLVDVITFKSSPHPYYLPKFKDVFSWSLPYIASKGTFLMTHRYYKLTWSFGQASQKKIAV